MKKIYFILQISFNAITKNAVRSFLSVLGIAIGIAAVISMLGLGNGAKTSIEKNIQKLGSNTITISSSQTQGVPGGRLPNVNGNSSAKSSPTPSIPITQEDYNFLSQKLPLEISNISSVSGTTTDSGQVELSDKSLINAQISAITSDYFTTQGLNLKTGKTDLKNSTNVVLGSDLADQLKKDKNLNNLDELLGTKIVLSEKEFVVAGVLEKSDLPLLAANNSSVFEDSEYYFKNNPNKKFFNQIILRVKESNSLSTTKSDVESKFREFRGLKSGEEKNFNISTTADLASSVNQITDIVTTLLAGISGISLLVGGIGISNIMLVSVTERTREIGLRKAIGAKRKYILWQFLVESVLLTVIGGIFGVVGGYILGVSVGSFINLEVSIKLENVALATGISSAIGMFFGFVPAWRASRLSPVEALRHE